MDRRATMDLLTTDTFPLGKTLTYSYREAEWFGQDANGFGGVIIRLWDEKRRERGGNSGRFGFESDFYEVKEEDPPMGVMARAFTFLNITDGGQKFEYRVLVGRNESCTCRAGLCHIPDCKHVSAVRAALESGFWDGLDDDPAPPDFIEQPGEATNYELTTA
jgi:hypothetical protein